MRTPGVTATGARTPFYRGSYYDGAACRMINTRGTIYLARCERFHKVGFTQLGAAKRITALQHSNPFSVELVRAWPGSQWDEWAWHQRLWRYRVRGEWYELPDEVLAELMDGLLKERA